MIEALKSYQTRNNEQLDAWLDRYPFQQQRLIEPCATPCFSAANVQGLF
ncbi:dimethylallyltransferase [Vibrio maritimus]|uniref:Dimethylallyltransferase n=1 Tax=Vibrio maritimus TaxID=990268 RepID=A0A090SK37_9VIBR|nr:dimethylallyltransferase [Vibrio maritimus]